MAPRLLHGTTPHQGLTTPQLARPFTGPSQSSRTTAHLDPSIKCGLTLSKFAFKVQRQSRQLQLVRRLGAFEGSKWKTEAAEGGPGAGTEAWERPVRSEGKKEKVPGELWHIGSEWEWTQLDWKEWSRRSGRVPGGHTVGGGPEWGGPETSG